MPQFHPILYSLPDGAAFSKTVEADSPDEACRQAAASHLELSLPEVDRMLEKRQLEVVAVIKGNPQFEQTKNIPLFPAC